MAKSTLGARYSTFLASSFFTYSITREATIHSVKISLTFRLIQLCIIAYIIG